MRIVPGLADAGWHDLEQSGAYEWWYVDAISDDGRTAFVFIWFAGLPFSPDYLTDHERGRSPSALDHVAMFAAVYRDGRQICYALNRHSRADFAADRSDVNVRVGSSSVERDTATGRIAVTLDVPILFGGTRLTGALAVDPIGNPALLDVGDRRAAGDHVWNPIAPACHIDGDLALFGRDGASSWTPAFEGTGYLDHNFGTRPLTEGIRRWHWGRAHLGDQTLVFYHTEPESGPESTVLASVAATGSTRSAGTPQFEASSWRRRPLCPRFPTALAISGDGVTFRTSVKSILDWGPFYMRFLAEVSAEVDGSLRSGLAITEYLDPRGLRARWLRPLIKTRIRTIKPATAGP